MDVSILTYNLAMVPNYFFFWGGKYLHQRTNILLNEIRANSDKYDILCFQEVFRESIRKRLYQGLADIYPFITAKKGLDVFGGQDSGLFFASKFPIINQQFKRDFVKFATHKATLWDRHTAKGVLASCLQVTENKFLWIFNTHLQSRNDNRPIREDQLRTVYRFIQTNMATISLFAGTVKNHSIILLGDFNIEGDTKGPISEYLDLLDFLHKPQDLFRIKNKKEKGYTWNSKDNRYLQKKYKNDTKMQRLDYIFALDSLDMGNPQGLVKLSKVKCCRGQVVKLKSKDIGGIADDFDLSDHYGVEAIITIL